MAAALARKSRRSSSSLFLSSHFQREREREKRWHSLTNNDVNIAYTYARYYVRLLGGAKHGLMGGFAESIPVKKKERNKRNNRDKKKNSGVDTISARP